MPKELFDNIRNIGANSWIQDSINRVDQSAVIDLIAMLSQQAEYFSRQKVIYDFEVTHAKSPELGISKYHFGMSLNLVHQDQLMLPW